MLISSTRRRLTRLKVPRWNLGSSLYSFGALAFVPSIRRPDLRVVSVRKLLTSNRSDALSDQDPSLYADLSTGITISWTLLTATQNRTQSSTSQKKSDAQQLNQPPSLHSPNVVSFSAASAALFLEMDRKEGSAAEVKHKTLPKLIKCSLILVVKTS